MTRQSHDQFAKEYLEELLITVGTIKKSEKVKSEVQEIDVWFEPFPTPTQENLLEILADWRKNLELRDNLSREEEEVIMNLSPAYLQQIEDWKQEGKEEGKEEGRQEGQLLLITSLLEGRFGSLDAELSGAVEKIAKFPIAERTQLLLSLGSLSREELLERLRNREE